MPMRPVGHLMEAIERHLRKDSALTAAELCQRTGYATPTVHDSLQRLLRLKRVTRTRPPLGRWGRKGGSPPFFYTLRDPAELHGGPPCGEQLAVQDRKT